MVATQSFDIVKPRKEVRKMLTKERRSFVYGSWRVKLVAEEMKLGNTVYVKEYEVV